MDHKPQIDDQPQMAPLLMADPNESPASASELPFVPVGPLVWKKSSPELDTQETSTQSSEQENISLEKGSGEETQTKSFSKRMSSPHYLINRSKTNDGTSVNTDSASKKQQESTVKEVQKQEIQEVQEGKNQETVYPLEGSSNLTNPAPDPSLIVKDPNLIGKVKDKQKASDNTLQGKFNKFFKLSGLKKRQNTDKTSKFKFNVVRGIAKLIGDKEVEEEASLELQKEKTIQPTTSISQAKVLGDFEEMKVFSGLSLSRESATKIRLELSGIRLSDLFPNNPAFSGSEISLGESIFLSNGYSTNLNLSTPVENFLTTATTVGPKELNKSLLQNSCTTTINNKISELEINFQENPVTIENSSSNESFFSAEEEILTISKKIAEMPTSSQAENSSPEILIPAGSVKGVYAVGNKGFLLSPQLTNLYRNTLQLGNNSIIISQDSFENVIKKTVPFDLQPVFDIFNKTPKIKGIALDENAVVSTYAMNVSGENTVMGFYKVPFFSKVTVAERKTSFQRFKKSIGAKVQKLFKRKQTSLTSAGSSFSEATKGFDPPLLETAKSGNIVTEALYNRQESQTAAEAEDYFCVPQGQVPDELVVKDEGKMRRVVVREINSLNKKYAQEVVTKIVNSRNDLRELLIGYGFVWTEFLKNGTALDPNSLNYYENGFKSYDISNRTTVEGNLDDAFRDVALADAWKRSHISNEFKALELSINFPINLKNALENTHVKKLFYFYAYYIGSIEKSYVKPQYNTIGKQKNWLAYLKSLPSNKLVQKEIDYINKLQQGLLQNSHIPDILRVTDLQKSPQYPSSILSPATFYTNQNYYKSLKATVKSCKQIAKNCDSFLKNPDIKRFFKDTLNGELTDIEIEKQLNDLVISYKREILRVNTMRLDLDHFNVQEIRSVLNNLVTNDLRKQSTQDPHVSAFIPKLANALRTSEQNPLLPQERAIVLKLLGLSSYLIGTYMYSILDNNTLATFQLKLKPFFHATNTLKVAEKEVNTLKKALGQKNKTKATQLTEAESFVTDQKNVKNQIEEYAKALVIDAKEVDFTDEEITASLKNMVKGMVCESYELSNREIQPLKLPRQFECLYSEILLLIDFFTAALQEQTLSVDINQFQKTVEEFLLFFNSACETMVEKSKSNLVKERLRTKLENGFFSVLYQINMNSCYYSQNYYQWLNTLENIFKNQSKSPFLIASLGSPNVKDNNDRIALQYYLITSKLQLLRKTESFIYQIDAFKSPSVKSFLNKFNLSLSTQASSSNNPSSSS